ncbi:MAG: tetratricopeptide repeat protein [Cystobacterineae bacterium]|nr:tetratricopeptide repeat protein [Cystobacterineae bacterium]
MLWGLALGLLSCKQRAEQALHQAEAFWVAGDYGKALVHYEEALGALPEDSMRTSENCELRSRILKGTADIYYLHANNPSRAANLYAQLIRHCPHAVLAQNARILLAEIQHSHFADLPGAIASLSKVKSQSNEQAEVVALRIASLYFEGKDYPQAALESKTLAHSNSPMAKDALLLHAQALSMSKETLSEATHAFSELVQRFPDSALAPLALFELGKLASMEGNEELAIHWWALSLKNHPNPQVVQMAIAAARERLATKTPDGIGNPERAFDRDTIKDTPQLPPLSAPSGKKPPPVAPHTSAPNTASPKELGP